MIKVENIQVFNFEGAIRGMRNPLNSWNKSDSVLCKGKDFEDCVSNCDSCPRRDEEFNDDVFCIGKNDLDLMRRLYQAGPEHAKYLRQIFISMDITAPLYLWKEIDQYRINVTTNSCSTMHTIHKKKFELDDFSHEHLHHMFKESLKDTIITLNNARNKYLETKDKDYWWQMIQLLPTSYNQKRTITMNYENVVNIIKQRTGHKLDEWNEFCKILQELPYIKEITNA